MILRFLERSVRDECTERTFDIYKATSRAPPLAKLAPAPDLRAESKLSRHFTLLHRWTLNFCVQNIYLVFTS